MATVLSLTHRNTRPDYNLKIIGIPMLCLLLVFLTKIKAELIQDIPESVMGGQELLLRA